MKQLLLAVFCFLPCCGLFAGGPSLYSNDLLVKEVLLFPDRVIMKVDGTIELFTSRVPEEILEGGNAKTVSLVVKDSVLIIPKKKWKHPGGDEFEIYLDWNEYSSGLEKWAGKKIFTQMWSTELVLLDGMVREIVADYCKIWEHQEQ